MAHKLPPLNSLRIFEVAARAGSYTAAAQELSLTHGAVSRQIDILENWLGQPLFVRNGQRMAATEHARAFAREISAAFDHISDASYRYGKAATSKVIRVNAPASFAMRWLIPQLSTFRSFYPDTDVRVSTALSTESNLKGNFDIVIRRDANAPGQSEATKIFTEWSTVVVSPSLLTGNRLRDPKDLDQEVLLSTETRPGDWETWLTEAGHASLRPSQILRFDHFFVTLQAVIDGLGLGIGTFPTLDGDRQAGRISTPFGRIRVDGDTYRAHVPLDADKPIHLRQFIEWLAAAGKKAEIQVALP
jgi:LysR family glycine cleavage system transcriptional activator